MFSLLKYLRKYFFMGVLKRVPFFLNVKKIDVFFLQCLNELAWNDPFVYRLAAD